MGYKCLNKQIFDKGNYALVPIRFEDRFDIMKWRNEQIYHLRQSRPLNAEDQDAYFNNVIAKLFDLEEPNQILFSFLENDKCIGYGGLVHINWLDKNAEVSFIMETSLESNYFHEIWQAYLKLIELVAFDSLKFHKIYTYAFDLRPHLYESLESANFFEDTRLKQHAIFEGKAIDVLIHSKINQGTYLVLANEDDVDITFNWVSDKKVRQFSFNKSDISYTEHKSWFLSKIKDADCYYYILKSGGQKVGSIRLDHDRKTNQGLISYLIDSAFHGKGLGTLILSLFEELLKSKFEHLILVGFVLKNNHASIQIFNKLGYDTISSDNDVLKFYKKIQK